MRSQESLKQGQEAGHYDQLRTELKSLRITKKERRAMILGALQVFLPVVLIMAFLYFGVLLLIF